MKLPLRVSLPISLAVGLLLGGCVTPETHPAPAKKTSNPAPAPVPPPAKPKPASPPPVAVAPVAPAPTAKPLPAVPAKPAIPNPALRPEVTATVERLTQSGGGDDALAHELVDTTGFPEAMASLAPGATAPKTERNIDNSSQPPAKGLTADGISTALVEQDWTGLVLVPINTSLSKAYTTEVRLLKVEAHPLHDGRIRVWIRVKNLGDSPLPTEIACVYRMQGEGTPASPYFYELEVPGRTYRDVFFVSPAGQLNSYTVLVRPRFNYQ